MNGNNFTYQEVFLAYKKLKNYFYNDNTSLFIKQRLVEFEEEIKFEDEFQETLTTKFNEVLSLLNSPLNEIEKYLSKVIKCKITPKSLKLEKKNVLTNRTNTEGIAVERINYFIDAPVEVHLMSVLWVTEVGTYIQKLLNDDTFKL